MDEPKTNKTKELLDRLSEGISELFESEKYKAYLKFLSRFHSYSANNCLLIMLQCPTATMVAPYSVWNDSGRQVKRGAKSIRIIAPHTYKTEENGKEVEHVGFHSASVFDLADTYSLSGEGVPEICDYLSGDVSDFGSLVEALRKISPVPVVFEDIAKQGLNGYHSEKEQRIVIRAGMSERQTIKTLVHEVAHAVMHSKGAEAADANRSEREVQAESVAFVVSEYLGLDTSDYSFGYIAGWSRGRELPELRKSLDLIRRVSDIIIQRIEGMMSDAA